MKKQNKGGRPKSASPRGRKFTIRFTQTEWERIERIAKTLNYNPAVLLRAAFTEFVMKRHL